MLILPIDLAQWKIYFSVLILALPALIFYFLAILHHQTWSFLSHVIAQRKQKSEKFKLRDGLVKMSYGMQQEAQAENINHGAWLCNWSAHRSQRRKTRFSQSKPKTAAIFSCLLYSKSVNARSSACFQSREISLVGTLHSSCQHRQHPWLLIKVTQKL